MIPTERNMARPPLPSSPALLDHLRKLADRQLYPVAGLFLYGRHKAMFGFLDPIPNTATLGDGTLCSPTPITGIKDRLSVHETAEEELVHPEVHRRQGGKRVANARIKEEHHAKELLSTLDKIGPDAEGFDTLLRELRDDVLAHAEHEEREEFPLLRKTVDENRLRAMADTVRAAEAIAPTHPHPGVESAAANVILGPPTAVMDRTRDAIRSVLRQQS
ncbi:hemerythrin domain-containing protein [Amycolatopsis pigmentata]|uniref:Hemerythrin domain-containing protein n=1 Tax=Amycolatopsis pigmentata TaxID=450801 RepID=A0ABW5FII9_9PSEU